MPSPLLASVQSFETTDSSSNSSPDYSPESTAPSSPSTVIIDHKLSHTNRLPSHFPALPESTPPSQVSSQDVQTPDNWVVRDGRLIRLTGKHPFNCEAKLSDLFAAGFLTPTELFYVRNHGAVPRVDEELARNWSLRVHGLVKNECALTLDDLKRKFPVVTLPVTLVCAGNRRKEQNMVLKGLGFSWGAAGVSTALFTGVYLADVLEYVQPIRPAAKHVIFEGTDSLPNGPYGTSQRLSWAASKEKGMLLAWAMNGLSLTPDHGFPLRVVVPGQIGGRSVKWLNRIEVSEEESQHYLHFFDNKVLPTQLSPEQARDEKKWWYDPKYLINDLNVNSAIAKPDHEERVEIPQPEDAKDLFYPIRGYAYAGGGRRITRVEISLDEGTTWTLAEITYPEDLYRTVCYNDESYGTLDLTERDTCFCWCFWTFPISLSELSRSHSIMCRAMDESLALQQRDMYWNPTGMMKWFRIAVHRVEVEGRTVLQFEHPTLAGTASGGWMQRMKEAGQSVTTPIFGTLQTSLNEPTTPSQPVEIISMKNPDIKRVITIEELKAQPKEQPWFVVDGEVYDGTGYLADHPGGADSIILTAGQDASEDFFAIHSPDAKKKMAAFHIGTLVKGEGSLQADDSSDDEESSHFLHKTKWKPIKLQTITPISPDTSIFRFALQTPEQRLGLPVGQHVFVRLKRKDTGEVVQRAYTPVSREQEVGHIDLLVKMYLPTDEYPQGGKMSIGFHQLIVDDTIELKGPLGSFVWNGNGTALWKGIERRVRNIGLICAGSGITPILQVLRSVLEDSTDHETTLWLLDSNRTEQDILCRDELLTFAERKGRMKAHFTLSKSPSEGWTFSTGRINDEMMKAHLPSPDTPDTLILICGPDNLIKQTVKPGLERLDRQQNQSANVSEKYKLNKFNLFPNLEDWYNHLAPIIYMPSRTEMARRLLVGICFYSIALALTNHDTQLERQNVKRSERFLENATIFGQETSSITTRTARLRTNLPVFELIYGRTADYELGRALEENMLVKGHPLSKLTYEVEPDLAMFNWMGFDQTKHILRGTPPIAQPLPIPSGSPAYLDIYVYIGTDRSYRLRAVLGLIIREASEITEPNSAPTVSLVPTDQQASSPRGPVLGALITACVLLALLIIGGIGWMISMRGYFKQDHRYSDTNSHHQSTIRPHRSNSPSIPSTSNRNTSITLTRRRVRTADHEIQSPSKSGFQLSPGQNDTKGSSPHSARKRATTLLQTIQTRTIHGSPKIGLVNSTSRFSLDSSSITARKAFSPRLGLSQFSPSFTIEESPKKEKDSLGIEKSPIYMNSWSSALRLDPFHSPGQKADSVVGIERERPISPTPNKALRIRGNRTMSVSELFPPDHLGNESGPGVAVDDSGISPNRYDHTGNLGFMNDNSTQLGSSAQVTSQIPAIPSRAESYVERTNQLGVALLNPPEDMHTKPVNGALGITFDSFFSPVKGQSNPEPRYGEVSSERMVKIGHSQETLATVYVTASESGVSPGVQSGQDSPNDGPGIPECVVIGSPITLHSQIVEFDNVATSPFITGPDTMIVSKGEIVYRALDTGNSSNSLRVEYGRADRSLRALDSFPAMLRGSLSCFPEDVSLNTPMLNTPVLPSTGTVRSDLTHREESDIMLLPTDDLSQGCLVLTRVGENSVEQGKGADTNGNAGVLSFEVIQEASNLVIRSEGDSILSPDLSEHTEQTDSIVSREQDSNMRSSVDSIMRSRSSSG
ncbi:Nitrate reductase [NADH] [Rhizoctonia solani]|uniref:Nitrate reductase [NADPH] n=1 Tax=Rhizoctonia solani TaxID=456999 RepID=A0A8H7LEH9_9AGAM|nr:Nitrate reductase [NADH] [Rhizoctonia solani]